MKLPEQNKWLIILIAVCVTILLAASILSNSGRYVPVPTESSSVTILDTKTGDLYTETTGVKQGKRVWYRRRLRDGVFK